VITKLSVSVDVLLPGFVSVVPAAAATVAVFTNVPVAAEEICDTTVKTTDAPTGTFTGEFMLPVPDAAQVPPPDAAQVQEADVIADGRLSTTVAPAALLGPLLVTVIV
jgi:hypothetical protein